MDFSNDSNLFAANSQRFFFNSAYIQNEWMGNELQPNQNNFSERNWLDMRTDKTTVIVDEPDSNLGDISTKIEIDESDFMHIAIDEIKTEWPNEFNLPTFPEGKLSTWIPPNFQPESPLPTLSNFTFSDVLANLPPVSPSPEEEPLQHFQPENFLLVKEEKPQSENQPLSDHSLATVEWALPLSYALDTGEDDTPTKDSLSALLIPPIDPAAKGESKPYIDRLPDEDDDKETTDGDTRSESSWQWYDTSDEEFAKKFEREEHIEQILQNYHRGGINTDDNFIYCDLCNRRWSQNCPHHDKLKTQIKDRQVLMGSRDRAIKTAPYFLSVLKSKIRGANKGVWTSQSIPRRTYFGPYEGCVVPVDHPNGEYCWKVMEDGKAAFLVDGSDPSKSNWMRYVNCARTAEEQNLEAFQYHKKIYYRTTKDIKANDELLIWYGYKYAKKLGIRWRDFAESNLKSDPLKKDVNSKTQPSPCSDTESPTESPVCMEVMTGDKPITCGVCGARFRRRGRPLQTHMKEHTDQPHHCCSRCGQWFPNEQCLDEHRTAFAKARKNRTNDVICGMDFTKRPKRTKKIIPDPPNCTKELRRKSTATSVEQEVTKKAVTARDTSKYSLCDKCGALFPRKCLLLAHLEKRHGIPFERKVVRKKRLPARRFKCAECGVTYRERSTLKSHLKIHDERTSESEVMEDAGKELLFSCEICSMKFRAEITLQYHAKTHKGAKPSSHERKENAPKKYKCKECKMRFRARSTLDLHVKTHEKREPPMKCLMSSSLLDRGGGGERVSKDAVRSKDTHKTRFFSKEEGRFLKRKEPLKREIDNHNALQKKRRRISSMECMACGFIFKDRNALDDHVLKHTKEKILVCDLSRARIPL